MTTYASVEELTAAIGDEGGAGEQLSDWFEIDQKRIDTFADATGDHQWIHVDADRAAAGPFGSTIAHGYLTLSLLAPMMMGLIELEGSPMVINYGLDRVRFLNPVKVGGRVRGHCRLSAVAPTPQGVRVTTTVTVEIEGVDRPALVADSIALFILPS